MASYYIGSMAFSDDSDILHYGVLGMKWGVRKEYSSNSDRRLKRTIKKRINRNNLKPREKRNNKNLKEAKDKIEKEIGKTKEAQQFFSLKYPDNLFDDLAIKRGGAEKLTKKDIARVTTQQKRYAKSLDSYLKIYNEIMSSHKGEILGAKLRDINVKDTERGRKILGDMLLNERFWYTDYTPIRK